MVICSPQLGLSPDSILGGEVFDREILLGLAKKGVKIEVILPKGLPHDKQADIHFTYIPFAHFPAPLFNILALPYIFQVNSRKNIDVLRLHQPQFIGIAALVFKIFHPNVKVIATYHQFREVKFGPFTKYLLKNWDHIICDSTAVKNKIVNDYGITGNCITVVHNGVPRSLEPEGRDALLEKKYNLKGKSVLLFMGLFIDRKNPLFLLRVLKKVISRSPNTVLIFLGKGPLKEQIISQAKDLGITGNIRVLDPVFGEVKNKIHNLSDIFLHPALDEGFALAPLEAMTCAKPVVMNDTHSARELIKDNYNGFLCKTNNVSSWINAIISLIRNPSKQERLGENALLRVKKEFTWDLAVNEHLKILKTLK